MAIPRRQADPNNPRRRWRNTLGHAVKHSSRRRKTGVRRLDFRKHVRIGIVKYIRTRFTYREPASACWYAAPAQKENTNAQKVFALSVHAEHGSSAARRRLAGRCGVGELIEQERTDRDAG